MGVDDRRDRPAALAGISEQPVAMLGMAAGIDQDQPVRRIEEDAVPVRPAIGDDAAGDQVKRLARGGLRAVAQSRANGRDEQCIEQLHADAPCPRTAWRAWRAERVASALSAGGGCGFDENSYRARRLQRRPADRLGRRRQPRFERGQPARRVGADADLRVRGLAADLPLPAGDQGPRLLEGGRERLRLAQRAVDHRVAEEGPVILRDAAEGGAVGRGGGDDRGRLRPEPRHEHAGIAGAEDQQPVADAEPVQHPRQPVRRDRAIAVVGVVIIEPERRAVAGRVEDQHVLALVHQLGDPGEGDGERRRRAARQGRGGAAVRAGEHDRPPGRAVAAAEHLARRPAPRGRTPDRCRARRRRHRRRPCPARCGCSAASARSSLRCSSSSPAGERSRSIWVPVIGAPHDLRRRAGDEQRRRPAGMARRLEGLGRGGRRQDQRQRRDQLQPAPHSARSPDSLGINLAGGAAHASLGVRRAGRPLRILAVHPAEIGRRRAPALRAATTSLPCSGIRPNVRARSPGSAPAR